MKTLKSALVMSGIASAAVLAFAAPAVACPDHHSGNSNNASAQGGYGHRHDHGGDVTVYGGDNVGILNGNCSILNLLALVDC
jgi:hypothetical protein